jgi:NADH dehydrogenase (ubiquinone) Fe-S protein 8
MLRAAFTASGPSAAGTSRILPMLASTSRLSTHRAFSSSSRALDDANHGGDVERLSSTSQSLYGSSKKAAQASPSSLVGGRVGVIAPSQAMTEDWAIQHDYPDYSKGPSALDKASRLFFFSEILRGMWVV